MTAGDAPADAALARLSGLLAERIGLYFPPERRADLAKGLASACRELGFADSASCLEGLLAAPVTPGQLDVLASHLTVGETYFLRDARTFEALEQRVVPELLRARDEADWRLRIWSAGCCTGEEPYTIAMLLDRALPEARKRKLFILASDINPRFLAKAARGVYGEWSFRAAPDWMRARYFTRRRDGLFEIRPEIRRMVTFSYLNLADDAYPSLATNTTALDIVFCRNVLMYFAPERVAATAQRLHRALCDGGWLFVSPSEMSQALFPQFAAADLGGALAYRKPAPDPGARRVAPQAASPPAAAIPDAATRATPRRDPAPPRPSAESGVASSAFEKARGEADAGRLDAALEWCRQALDLDRLDPARHYLYALIRLERGEPEAALRALGRTLYVEPEFVAAHVALGNLSLGQARLEEAERHFGNALELLRKLPSDEVVPESGGLSAGRVAEIVASMRAGLAPAPGVPAEHAG